ncbi:MAG: hypothetical protein JXA69_14665 [Phycisphaerae bacterium]|nr:hypothetical protein [Phycisphaerae bacterium]
MPTLAAVREAGYECETQAEATARLGVADLELGRSKKRAAAWARGQFLRKVAEIARETHWVAEAVDKHFGLGKGEFVQVLARDREVRELWESNRFALRVSLGKAIVARAEEGDAKALAAVEHLFGERPAAAAVDFERLTITQIEQATGISRTQFLRWSKGHHLPRNIDGTFALAKWVEWYGKWQRDKSGGGSESAGLNPMQAEKARLYRLQADEAEDRLIARTAVVEMVCARAARLVQLLGDNTAEEWAHAHEGLTAAQLKDAYTDAFRSLRGCWGQFPEEIPVPDEVRARLDEALSLLAAGGLDGEKGGKGEKGVKGVNETETSKDTNHP